MRAWGSDVSTFSISLPPLSPPIFFVLFVPFFSLYLLNAFAPGVGFGVAGGWGVGGVDRAFFLCKGFRVFCGLLFLDHFLCHFFLLGSIGFLFFVGYVLFRPTFYPFYFLFLVLCFGALFCISC